MVRGQGILVQEIKEETRFLGRKKWRPLFGGSFPCGNRVPLLPGGPCRGAELSEKYQVAHFGGYRRGSEKPHPACSYFSQQVELRNVPKGHPEPGPRACSETGNWALANRDSPISNGTPHPLQPSLHQPVLIPSPQKAVVTIKPHHSLSRPSYSKTRSLFPCGPLAQQDPTSRSSHSFSCSLPHTPPLEFP